MPVWKTHGKNLNAEIRRSKQIGISKVSITEMDSWRSISKKGGRAGGCLDHVGLGGIIRVRCWQGMTIKGGNSKGILADI